MALARALEPELVLCSACLDREDLESRWLPLRCGDDQALLVRDVCVRPRCPKLQVRGHLCVEHVLELELAWQGNYTVRACSGCRVSTLQLYADRHDVWFILKASEHTAAAHGVERRVKTPASASSDGAASPVRTRWAQAKRPLGKGKRRKSTRFIQQHGHKEEMAAFEWSLGNVSLEKGRYRHLWHDNQKRIDVEKDPLAYLAVMYPPPKPTPDPNVRPEPREVFCSVGGCGRFAKTGTRCRFHSSQSLPFVKSVVDDASGGTAAK